MKKRIGKTAAVFCILGALFIAAGIIIPEGASGRLVDLIRAEGPVFLLIGLIQAVWLVRFTADPEAEREAEASASDERTMYIRDKARSHTFIISVLIELAAGLVMTYFTDMQTEGRIICMFVCVQLLIFTVVSAVLKKRY